VSELVDLVGDLEAFSQVPGRRVGRILDHHAHALVPGVAVEVGADERAVLPHLVPGVRGAVDADEAAAPLDEVEQRAPNLRPEREAARRKEEDGPTPGQRLNGEARELVARAEPADVERAGALAKLHDGALGDGGTVRRLPPNDLVLVGAR